MNSEKVERFMKLAGLSTIESLATCSPEIRKLGAQLLLSETLEYVIKGLGVIPVFNEQPIDHPDGLEYEVDTTTAPDSLEMIDGLADVAYTMYWNAVAFSLPLEEAFEMVCDNNLEKFVPLEASYSSGADFSPEEWDCGQGIEWPAEVVRVFPQKVDGQWYAVGTDRNGKVRKPSTYASVDLRTLLPNVVDRQSL